MLQNQAELGVESGARQAAGTIRGAGGIHAAAKQAGDMAEVHSATTKGVLEREGKAKMIKSGIAGQSSSIEGTVRSIKTLGGINNYVDTVARKTAADMGALKSEMTTADAILGKNGFEQMKEGAAVSGSSAQSQKMSTFGSQDKMNQAASNILSSIQGMDEKQKVAADMVAKGILRKMPTFDKNGNATIIDAATGVSALAAYGRAEGDKIYESMKSGNLAGWNIKGNADAVNATLDKSSKMDSSQKQTVGYSKEGQVSQGVVDYAQSVGISKDAAISGVHGAQAAGEVANIGTQVAKIGIAGAAVFAGGSSVAAIAGGSAAVLGATVAAGSYLSPSKNPIVNADSVSDGLPLTTFRNNTTSNPDTTNASIITNDSISHSPFSNTAHSIAQAHTVSSFDMAQQQPQPNYAPVAPASTLVPPSTFAPPPMSRMEQQHKQSKTIETLGDIHNGISEQNFKTQALESQLYQASKHQAAMLTELKQISGTGKEAKKLEEE